MRFNLAHDPWIPVETLAGERTLESLQGTLNSAHLLRPLQDSSPLVVGGLYRLLLATLHRALAGPEDPEQAAAWLARGRFPQEVIKRYLDEYNDRFELFGDTPFWQIADWSLLGTQRGLMTRLAPERASGINVLLFDHTYNSAFEGVSSAEAARLLVAHQTFALGGGNSAFRYTAHAPVATAAHVLALSSNLFETLALNLVPYPKAERENDRPVWEAEPLRVADVEEGNARTPTGLTSRYTWTARSLRLHPEEDGSVREVSYASGVPVASEGGYNVAFVNDPMVCYRVDEEKGVVGLSYRAARAFWRDYRALLPVAEGSSFSPPATLVNARTLRPGEPQEVLVLGQANRQAKLLYWRQETFYIPPRLQRETDELAALDAALETIDALGQAVRFGTRRLAGALLSLNDTREPDKDAVTKLAATMPLELNYWTALERHFLAMLVSGAPWSELSDHGEKLARRVWRQAASEVGTSARSLRAVNRAQGAFFAAVKKAITPPETGEQPEAQSA